MSISRRWIVAAGVVLMACFLPLFSYAEVNDDVESAIKATFPQVPVMAEIARCESRSRQFYSEGAPLAGGTGGNMIGVFQINAPVHREYARSLGMDIYTLEGNLAYAKLLYENEGTRPWKSSFKCWGATSATRDEAAEKARLQAVLELTVQLVALQQKLALAQR